MGRDGSLNILLISHGLPPQSVGGVEQHVVGLARALVDAGHRVEIYARTDAAGPQGEHVADAGAAVPTTRVIYRYEDITSLAGLYAVPLLDRALRAFLASRRFDVAHIHHLTGMSTGLVDVLRQAGIPTVMTLHDYWSMCPRGQMWHSRGEACETVEPARCGDCLAPAFGGWLPAGQRAALLEQLHRDARALLARVDRLVVPSPHAIPPFAALGVPRQRFTIVENGVDTTALEALPPPESGGGPLRLGYLGTLIPSKGLDVLVDAFAQLPPGTATLDIFGNAVPYHGDETFLTRVFSRLAPGSGVTYHGPYHQAELPEILAGVDVVVAPARWREAFGLTVREGLAAGRPVVASRIGGLQDALEDGVEGRLVPPGDATALAAVLQSLAAAPDDLQRMSGAARRRARGFAAMTNELTNVYWDLVSLDHG